MQNLQKNPDCMPTVSNWEIAASAWKTYRKAPLLTRLLSSARTYICPMQSLLVEVPQGATVFDIGCGSGLFLSLLVAYNVIDYAVGTDVNAKALKSATIAISRQLQLSEMNVEFIRIENYRQWPVALFSVVSMIDVMHHIPPSHQKAFFEAAVQRVQPGGRLLYKDMCKRPLWRAIANRIHDLLLARQWIHYVPLATIKEWSQECGLELETESHYSRYVYGHEKLVFRKPLPSLG
ncbi:MAG: hypothetical protein B0A82_25850 [Alkalinema sp. CACIAM 70d]|nr:MAG: hypothetical protein B0A82_25850 [Alkalinema sp. CACIAM 70d]